jgi:hypothetical protein
MMEKNTEKKDWKTQVSERKRTKGCRKMGEIQASKATKTRFNCMGPARMHVQKDLNAEEERSNKDLERYRS